MEAAAKGTLMDCEGCKELLADFLLDELPESEAVLVHEHLLICPDCMQAYRELKGTGKALEAVPSMRSVEGSDAFKADVRKQAVIEADKIVAKLPADRRLRLEARREARQSIRMSRRQAPPKVWSPGLLILALAAAMVLAAVLFWPKADQHAQRSPVGTLGVTMGKVSQFFKEENKTYTQVAEGKTILPGENYVTDEPSRARFDLNDGGSIFAGPSSDVAFRLSAEGNEFGMRLENGELGIARPDSTGTAKPRDWEIRTPAGNVIVPASAGATHAYIHVNKGEKLSTLEVSVLSGSVKVATHDGHSTEPVHAGQRAAIASSDTSVAVESLNDERPPAWRADLLTDADLSTLVGGKARIVSRKPGRIQVELIYNRETQNQDWVPEIGSAGFAEKSGALSSPNVKLKLASPLAPPFSYDLKFNSDSRRDASLAFGINENPAGEVAVDVPATSHEAILSIYEKGRAARRESAPARLQPNTPETFTLQVKAEGAVYNASLVTSTGKTKWIPLWKGKSDTPGEIWFHSLGEGILVDEIKLSGMLPVDWIRKKMSGAQDD